MRNFFWLSFTGKNTRLLYFGFTMQTSSYSVVYLYYRASMLVILMKIPLSRICLLVSFSCSKIHAENCFFFGRIMMLQCGILIGELRLMASYIQNCSNVDPAQILQPHKGFKVKLEKYKQKMRFTIWTSSVSTNLISLYIFTRNDQSI